MTQSNTTDDINSIPLIELNTFNKQDIQLIIWDCDGVLVDSERLASRAFHDIITSLGGNLSEDYVYHSLKGGSIYKAVEFVHQHALVPDHMDVAATYRQLSFELFSRDLKPVSGVMRIVKSLIIRQCIASNGPLIKIHHNLKITGLDVHFPDPSIFSGHQIQKFKPDPELFLHAASSMSVHPDHCLVIEDSKQGAQAARSAEMLCLGYAAETDPNDFIHHDAWPFHNMLELFELLKSLNLLDSAIQVNNS